MDLYNSIGYIGTFLYILAYGLLQLKYIGQGKLYTILNLLGSSFVLFSLIKYWNGPSFVIQVIWIIISIIGLYLLYKNK